MIEGLALIEVLDNRYALDVSPQLLLDMSNVSAGFDVGGFSSDGLDTSRDTEQVAKASRIQIRRQALDPFSQNFLTFHFCRSLYVCLRFCFSCSDRHPLFNLLIPSKG